MASNSAVFNFQRKRVNFSDPCLTSKKIFIKEDYHSNIDSRRLFDSNDDNKELQKAFMDVLFGKEGIAESDNTETESSLQVVNAFLLKRDKPIYPKLIDCTDDVMVILKKVTSPLFITTLMNKLKSKRIRTIGELSMLSETEINRLPFKVPVVANVYRALDNYYKKKCIKDEVHERESVINGVQEEKEIVINADEPQAEVQTVTFREQLMNLVKSAENEVRFFNF